MEWIKTVDGSGVTASTPIFTVPDDQVYRLFAASAFQVVGPGPQAQIFVRDNTSTPNKAVSLSAFFAITVNNLNFPLATALVIGPGLVISGEQFNGGAASIVRFSIYGCVAPLGTAFYC